MLYSVGARVERVLESGGVLEAVAVESVDVRVGRRVSEAVAVESVGAGVERCVLEAAVL